MGKNIILLSDGTGNSNIKDRGTNVFKFYEALDFNSLHCDSNHSKQAQVAFYDDGVGTEDLKPLKLLGGAFGWGLARNVRSLYKRLVQVYDPGDPKNESNPRPADKIYLLGFSRGAFTVRTLAGLIASEGVLNLQEYRTDQELDLAILQLYENYRAKNTAMLERVLYQPLMQYFFKVFNGKKLNFHPNSSREIEFIGVWDTVDAVGFPIDEVTDLWNKIIFRFKFSNHDLNPNVKKAYHALSIDDQRRSFSPLLWNADGNRINQVWFPGVHANVGGGYPQQGLSLIALDWMIKNAEAAGLRFIPTIKQYVSDQKYAFDKLYDSRSGFGAYYRWKPRDISGYCREYEIERPQIHLSTFQRISEGILGYAPGNLPDKFTVVNDDGSIHPTSAEVSELVDKKQRGVPSLPLLQEVKILSFWRNLIYYVFLVYSFFTLYWVLRHKFDDADFFGRVAIAIKTLLAPDELLDSLLLLLSSDWWLSVIGLAIVFASILVRQKIQDKFSNFWSGIRVSLKDIIKNG